MDGAKAIQEISSRSGIKLLSSCHPLFSRSQESTEPLQVPFKAVVETWERGLRSLAGAARYANHRIRHDCKNSQGAPFQAV